MTTSPTIAPAITKGSTVLVTGATGFIGSWTALEFVKQGYRVRAPVRNRAKGRILKEVLEQEYGPNKVEIVIITDMTDPQVYDEAIKGVSAVVHVATDVSLSPDPDIVVKNTVAATKNLLDLAKQEQSIRRFVLTSSSTAVGLGNPDLPIHFDSKTWNDYAVNNVHTASNPGITYAASKTLGERAFWEGNTHFVRNTVLPDVTLGPAVHDQFRSSTHAWLRGFWNREEFGTQMVSTFRQQWYVNVEDVARLHVAAVVDEKIKNQRLLAFAGRYTANDVIDIGHRMDPNHALPERLEINDAPKNSADASAALKILKEAGRNGWVSLEETVQANLA